MNDIKQENKLTAKEEAFCLAFIKNLNATQSVKDAKYDVSTDETARAIGYENLTKPHIKNRISELMAESIAACKIDVNRILLEANRLALSDMRRIAKWNGDTVTLKDSLQISDDDAACVESVSQTISKDGGSISCKLHSKTKSLELMMKYFKLLTDNVNLGGQEDNPLVFGKTVEQMKAELIAFAEKQKAKP